MSEEVRATAPLITPELAAAQALSTEEPVPDQRHCLNCGAMLSGRYCSACGQKETERDPRLRELAHDAADELLHWDGKLVATLLALVRRPGLLTREYLAGRRARYVSPVRLYLTASVVYFAALALVPRTSVVRFDMRPDAKPAATATAKSTTSGAPQPQAADAAAKKTDAYRAAKRDLFGRVGRNPAKFEESFKHNRSKAMFALLPLFALFLRILYRRGGRYPAHFIFALHLHAFAFLLLGAITIPAAASAGFDVLEPFAFLAIVVYLAIALRCVYGGTWPATLARTGALAFGYLFAFAVTILALLALTALTFA